MQWSEPNKQFVRNRINVIKFLLAAIKYHTYIGNSDIVGNTYEYLVCF